MRFVLIALAILALPVAGFVGYRVWQFAHLWPATTNEIVQLTPEKRIHLLRLRSEHKFGPNDYPPLGYTGAPSPADKAVGTAAVNEVIDGVLAQSDHPIKSTAVANLIGRAMRKIDMLDTEDRDRAGGYMIEIWYIAGFKGATGRFAYGSYYKRPVGYGEPLPPGWTAPDKPRPFS